MSAAPPQHGRPRPGAGVYDPRSAGVGQVGPGPASPGPASSSARPGRRLTCSPYPAARMPSRRPSAPAFVDVFREMVKNMRGVATDFWEAGLGSERRSLIPFYLSGARELVPNPGLVPCS